jgi:hypothetical protein
MLIILSSLSCSLPGSSHMCLGKCRHDTVGYEPNIPVTRVESLELPMYQEMVSNSFVEISGPVCLALSVSVS